eukprot:scaffold2539_cov388-Prasinococcus_capsulatus_cf.AAC.14
MAHEPQHLVAGGPVHSLDQPQHPRTHRGCHGQVSEPDGACATAHSAESPHYGVHRGSVTCDADLRRNHALAEPCLVTHFDGFIVQECPYKATPGQGR